MAAGCPATSKHLLQLIPATAKEDRNEHNTLSQRCENNRRGEDGAGSARIASGGFGCLCAHDSHANGGTESGEANM